MMDTFGWGGMTPAIQFMMMPVYADILRIQAIEFNDQVSGSANVVSDYSNVPYNNMQYKHINDVGKQWVRKYGLALTKELLGLIRSKYGSIPVPNAETTLDGDTLRSEATTEKEFLVTQLRENLEASSRKMMLEADSEE